MYPFRHADVPFGVHVPQVGKPCTRLLTFKAGFYYFDGTENWPIKCATYACWSIPKRTGQCEWVSRFVGLQRCLLPFI